MREIIDWLIKVEKLASDFYRDAAELYRDDNKIYRFLCDAAEDEAMHFQVMESAKSHLESFTIPESLILLDEKAKHKLETPFTLAFKGIENKSLSLEQLIDCIIETEFSEWNKIFLYVVDSLKQQNAKFNFVAAKMQNHLGRIMHFIESFPYGASKVVELHLLDRVFDENILVVDDNEILAEFMQSLLEDEGNVEVAYDGKDALEKLNKKYYKLIVSDIEMPVMDGLEFYKQATARFPTVKGRFMFVSGYSSPETIRFAETNRIVLLSKPALLEDIMSNAKRIIYEVKPAN